MSVIFELKPNARHAAKQRRGFLRFAVVAVLASVGSMESIRKTDKHYSAGKPACIAKWNLGNGKCESVNVFFI